MGCLKLKYESKDFSPFGSAMESRSFSSRDYKYGFNGMEKDEETYGSGNAYDFGARIYDGRLGRWFSNDPLTRKYPYLSPYSFCYDNPIIFKDIDGKDFIIVIDKDAGTIAITATYYVNNKETEELTQKAVQEIMNTNGIFQFGSGKNQYDIIFDIDVINVNELDPESSAVSEAHNDKKGNSVREYPTEEFKEEVRRITGIKNLKLTNEDASTIIYGHHIITKNNDFTKEQRIHAIKTEILHTLGASFPSNVLPDMSTTIDKKRIREIMLYAMRRDANKIKIKGITPVEVYYDNPFFDYTHDPSASIEVKPESKYPITGKIKKKKKKKKPEKKNELTPRYLNKDPDIF